MWRRARSPSLRGPSHGPRARSRRCWRAARKRAGSLGRWATCRRGPGCWPGCCRRCCGCWGAARAPRWRRSRHRRSSSRDSGAWNGSFRACWPTTSSTRRRVPATDWPARCGRRASSRRWPSTSCACATDCAPRGTLRGAGADGRPPAAGATAARLAPRNAVVRRARRLLPPPDAASESLLAVGPATPAEWWLAATFAWWLAWALVLARRRARWPAALAVLACLAGGLGTVEWRHRQRPVAVVLAPATPVRVAPYGSATAGTSLDVGAAVLVEDHYGAWLRVARPDGVRGWVLARDVATL